MKDDNDKYYATIKMKIRIDKYAEFIEYIKKFGSVGIAKEEFTDKADADMVESLLDDDKVEN